MNKIIKAAVVATVMMSAGSVFAAAQTGVVCKNQLRQISRDASTNPVQVAKSSTAPVKVINGKVVQ